MRRATHFLSLVRDFSYGKKQRDSLADFKRHNGFQKVDLPRYYVPLTAAGRIALRLGLQHGISERILNRSPTHTGES